MSTSFIGGYGTQPLPLLHQGEVWGSEEMLQSVRVLYEAALEHFHLSTRTLGEIGKIYEKALACRTQEMQAQVSVIDLMRRISASDSLSVDVHPVSTKRPLKRKELPQNLMPPQKRQETLLNAPEPDFFRDVL